MKLNLKCTQRYKVCYIVLTIFPTLKKLYKWRWGSYGDRCTVKTCLLNWRKLFCVCGYLYLRFVFLLQILHVNLNNMMCPAVSDPFSGPYYRIIACCHQPALMFLTGKVFCIIGHELVAVLFRTQPEKLE